MSKKIISILLFSCFAAFSIVSCSERVIVNRQVDNSKDGKMLLGTQTKSQFSQEPFNEWYKKEYSEYKMDLASVELLKKEKLNSYQIMVFMGTWCEDSHREFPRLMKILDATKYPEQKLTIIAVNRKKESPSGEEGQFNIQKVPTIIVKRYGREIGRIIEAPKSGWLEKDLLQIIKKDNTSFKDLFK